MRATYVIGINVGHTEFGKRLHDGGACIVSSRGVIAALAEERVTRVKRCGGYSESAKMLFHATGIAPANIDCAVVSSCCDPEPSEVVLSDLDYTAEVISCNHHVSHAMSAFCTSPFERALILVLDGGGNVYGSPGNTNWWELSREQHTYYLGDHTGIVEIGRDFSEPFATGFGEAYRAFTYYLGWPSSRFAGNVMALAGYGDALAFDTSRLFPMDDRGQLSSPIRNIPTEPIRMAKGILEKHNIPYNSARTAGKPIEQYYKNVAAWVQHQLEIALVDTVDRLIEKTGLRDVCLAGGVAYNCKAIAYVKQYSKAKRIYVSPASGDHGQCLGNALFGLWTLRDKLPQFFPLSPYLGPRHKLRSSKVKPLSAPDGYVALRPSDICSFVAKLLCRGHIIGWYQGRSEFGPRALGNRSILASPSLAGIKNRINKAKGRESFMPFAPSVLLDRVADYFCCSEEIPYMSELSFAHKDRQPLIEGVLNADGSSRVHTVSSCSNGKLFRLISAFHRLTRIPMVLNTSFNGAGEPIVENLEDAVQSCLELELDALVVEDYVMMKSRLWYSSDDKLNCKLGDSPEEELEIDSLILKLVNVYKDKPLIPRDRFLLNAVFFDWLKHGKKVTTIRYRKGAIEYPIDVVMPLYVTEDYSKSPRGGKEASVRVRGYHVKSFGELTDNDAIRDGFKNASELHTILGRIYGSVSNNDPVAIYGIELIDGT